MQLVKDIAYNSWETNELCWSYNNLAKRRIWSVTLIDNKPYMTSNTSSHYTATFLSINLMQQFIIADQIKKNSIHKLIF